MLEIIHIQGLIDYQSAIARTGHFNPLTFFVSYVQPLLNRIYTVGGLPTYTQSRFFSDNRALINYVPDIGWIPYTHQEPGSGFSADEPGSDNHLGSDSELPFEFYSESEPGSDPGSGLGPGPGFGSGSGPTFD